MPEGPEIRRAADTLRRALAGKVATRVTFAADKFPGLQAAGRRLAGCIVSQVEPRGKAMLTHFAGGTTIYSHNQLYGEWRVFKGLPPASHLQTRLTIATESHTAVLYSASDISVLKTRELNRHPYIAKLGVELLDPAVSLAQVLAHMDQPRFARRSLAALLLDQGFLAGIGNYLRSDILFVAGLAPDTRLFDLPAPHRRKLAEAALSLTRRAYTTRGVTNDPAHARRLKALGQSFGEYRHWVFDRTGEACRVCGTPIRRLNFGARGLYLCDHCQLGQPPSATPD